MSWTYSQALAAEYSAVCFADTESSARLNSIRSVDLFLHNGKTTDTCRLSRFGMTFEHLTDDDGEALLTWYQEDSLAKTLALPETEPVLRERSPLSGYRCSVSFGRFDLVTSLWKTPPNLFGMDSTLSSAAWSRAGTMRNGVCWARPTWVRLISGSDAGFLVGTPTTKERRPSEKSKRKTPTLGELERIPTPTVSGNHNRKGLSKNSGDGLATFVKKQMWRTPIASQGRQDGQLKKYASKPSSKTGRNDRQIKLSDQVGGKLNPAFVEWLMMFPIGFTALKVLETPKCRCVPPLRGRCCLNEFMNSKEAAQ